MFTPERYVFFTCPEAPGLQIVSLDIPRQCPVCQCARIRRTGRIETTPYEIQVAYSHE
jgi:hypothetical protein